MWKNCFTPLSAFKYCFVAVIVLAVLMASISKYDAHPDEKNHLSAAVYYADHSLPPVIGDPAVRDSYSIWGISYLNYQWAEYFFAGKFISLVSPLLHDEYLAARFFNVSLLFLLAGLFFYRSRKENSEFIIPCLLLMTPQVWYVFSYCNNDAFALFVSVLIAYQIAYPGSLLREFLSSNWSNLKSVGGVFFGILIGILMICKPNYWIFVLFTALWLLINFPLNLATLKKYAMIAVVAFLVVGARIGMDLYVNGETNFAGASYISYLQGDFEGSGSKLAAYQEEITPYEFRPSTFKNDLAHSPAEVRLRSKGVSAMQMLTEWRWHISSFQSFVGFYGYMNLLGPRWYYGTMLLLYFAFVIYIIPRFLISKERKAILQLALVAIACSASVFVSFYLSWNYALQAQGRYLFPIIPMVALLVYSNRTLLHNFVINGFLIITFILSVYSFVFVGLAKINNE